LNSYVGTLNSVTLDNSGIQSFDIPDGGSISATLTSIPSADFVHSVSVWVKFEGDTLTTSYPYLYFLGATGSYNGIGLYCAGASNPNKLHVSCWSLDFPINFTFSNDTWHHVTYTYSGGGWSRNSALNAYVDGIEYSLGVNRSSGTEGTTPTLTTSNVPLRIGTTSTGGAFDGKIANFRLFNRALTSDEIYQLYAYQKEYFGHGDLSMTLKAGRLGIGTSEPRAALDVRGGIAFGQSTLYYEEGQWTPTLGAISTPTYTEQIGYYTRIGNIVHLHFRITVNNLDNNDGSGIHISTPFNLATNNGQAASMGFSFDNTLFSEDLSNGGAYAAEQWIIPTRGQNSNGAIKYNNCGTSGTILGFATYSLRVIS
jgi:hypothetical protein